VESAHWQRRSRFFASNIVWGMAGGQKQKPNMSWDGRKFD